MSILRKLTRALAGLPLFCAALTAHAGVVFISGTDAMSFHGDASYINPVLKTLQGSSTKSVLVVGGGSINAGTSGVAVTYGGSALTATDDLSLYSGVIFQSPCCSDPEAAGRLGGRAADVAAYVAAGGSIYIEDYQGYAAWDTVLGFSGGASSVIDTLTCIDPGVSTASGLAFGFEASYTEGCFVHQSYTGSFWESKGFFALQTKTDAKAWVTFATGFTDPGTVPEPTSLALVGLALAGAAISRRRSA